MMNAGDLRVRIRCSTWRFRLVLSGVRLMLWLTPRRWSRVPMACAQKFVNAGARLIRVEVKPC